MICQRIKEEGRDGAGFGGHQAVKAALSISPEAIGKGR
jgi:hypothetical protein